MVPEFSIHGDCRDEGLFEEEICWNNVLSQLNWFYEKGFRNIVALDFDDLRTREFINGVCISKEEVDRVYDWKKKPRMALPNWICLVGRKIE